MAFPATQYRISSELGFTYAQNAAHLFSNEGISAGIVLLKDCRKSGRLALQHMQPANRTIWKLYDKSKGRPHCTRQQGYFAFN